MGSFFLMPGSAKVLFSSDFEEGNPDIFKKTFLQTRGELYLIDGKSSYPTYQHSRYSLVSSSAKVTNRFDLMFDEPVPLNQALYLVCAVRSEGLVSGVKVALLLEKESKPLFSQTGPVGIKPIGRWQNLVARLDQYDNNLADRKLRGIRFYQRCALGVEQPGRHAPEHHLLIDNIELLSPPDAAKASAIAAEEAGVREYEGRHKFQLFQNKDITIWHAPSIVPVFKNSAPPQYTGKAISLSAAKGEGESFQVVLTPGSTGRNKFSLAYDSLTLRDNEKIRLNSQCVEIHPVRYVALKSRLGQSIQMDWPDPLTWDRHSEQTGIHNTVFWVTVNII